MAQSYPKILWHTMDIEVKYNTSLIHMKRTQYKEHHIFSKVYSIFNGSKNCIHCLFNSKTKIFILYLSFDEWMSDWTEYTVYYVINLFIILVIQK